MNTLLKGVKVLDLTSFVAGPTSTQLMAYMGANVVKVEMPVCGDSGRGMMNMKIGHHSGNILQTNHGRKRRRFHLFAHLFHGQGPQRQDNPR